MLVDTVIGWWKSSTQKCVTAATCEVECVGLCDASKEALFMRAVQVFLQSDLIGMITTGRRQSPIINRVAHLKLHFREPKGSMQKSSLEEGVYVAPRGLCESLLR